MKLQDLSIIFCIIIIPVMLILSSYIDTQMKTINLQGTYDTKLVNSTHDAIVAFQKNTINNNFSSVADSQKRDVQASINVFFDSLSNNLGVSGYTKEYIQPYVPAILFTMYDGYYIYSPTKLPKEKFKPDGTRDGYEKDASGNLIYESRYVLKPYIYYAERYENDNIDVVINYSLDNYISVYGTVDGGKTTISKAGYLLNKNEMNITDTENISEKYIKIENNGSVKVETDSEANDESAKKYYEEAHEFSEWVYKNLYTLTVEDNKNEKKYINFGIFDKSQNPEDKSSNFEQHKREVIRYSILSNLQSAIQNYSGTSDYNFKIPIFTAEDWEKIYTNISMVSLLQGLPVGTKIYNNYSIVTSTGNDKYVAPEELYFIDKTTNIYHKINCPELEKMVISGNEIVGYKSVDFVQRKQKVTDKDTGNAKNVYYYKHDEQACYECIVNSKVGSAHEENGQLKNTINNKLKKAYYSALARERYNLDKATKFINDNN